MAARVVALPLGNRVNQFSKFFNISGAGVPARDAARGGKNPIRRHSSGWQALLAAASRRAGTPAPLRIPFTRLRRALPTLALILGSCVFHHHTDQHDLVIYSPNGEALTGGALGHPACAVAVARWLDQIDLHHDGYVTLDEYLADAKRQFRVMDLDKTGSLTPEELARYRAPFGSGISGHPGDDRASGNIGTDDRPDPVMAADSQAKFEVTLPEFIDYERQYFLALDGGQSGRVARDVFLQLCTQSS